jgi:hypothetical protein
MVGAMYNNTHNSRHSLGCYHPSSVHGLGLLTIGIKLIDGIDIIK